MTGVSLDDLPIIRCPEPPTIDPISEQDILGGLAVSCASADLADADGSCRATSNVGADLIEGPARRYRTVEIDDEKVSDVRPAEGVVLASNGVDAVFRAFWRGRAVYSDRVQWPLICSPMFI